MTVSQNGEPPPVPALHRHRSACVLIVEDEKIVAWDMEQTLIESGIVKVEAVSTLAEAQRIINGEQPISLVLLDLKLPDGDSSELVRELQEKAIPIVIVTGYTTSLIEGVPVLYKPFAAGELIRFVGAALDNPQREVTREISQQGASEDETADQRHANVAAVSPKACRSRREPTG
jgi:DNA-binding NtrC family response regulator